MCRPYNTRVSRGRESDTMLREFIAEKWPEVMVAVGVGMTCAAIAVTAF
jgi:hypothetical protein